MAEFPDRTVHFGSKDGSTYIDHYDDEIRDAWIARHSARGDFTNYESPAALARWLLWEEHTLTKATQALNMRQRTFNFRFQKRNNELVETTLHLLLRRSRNRR